MQTPVRSKSFDQNRFDEMEWMQTRHQCKANILEQENTLVRTGKHDDVTVKIATEKNRHVKKALLPTNKKKKNVRYTK